MGRGNRWWVAVLLMGGLLHGHTHAQDGARPFEGTTLTVLAHDSFTYTEDVLLAFQNETGMTVEVLRGGDAGTVVNQAILSAENPLGDVLFGVDNTFLGRALAADLFVPYQSPLLAEVDPAFILDPNYRVTPVDYGDVALNYDIAYFEAENLTPPDTLAALTDPAYAGLLVVPNPATSSPGLAFLLTTVATFGTEGDYTYLDYWADLVANDVLVVDDWTTAYYGEFTATSAEGQRPLVVSYASSPPAEVVFADPPRDDAPTVAIVAPGTAFRQIEFAGILRGTDDEAAAQAFIDFLLSVPFQEDMPLSMFVFPVNPNAPLPEVFAQFAQVAAEPVSVPYEDIEANRDAWITAWTDTVLR